MPRHLIALLSLLATGAANAAITYVDADPTTNTFDTATGSVNTSWYVSGSATTDDGLWGYRNDVANGSTVLQGASFSSPSDPPLTTQISGLSDGTYDVWVFFWDAADSNQWEITAGLSGNPLVTYSFDGDGNTTAPVATSTLSFTTSVLTTESARVMYGVNLGQATVSGGSTIDVLIEQQGAGNLQRTWYDGVGYEAIPEPSVALLVGLGGLALLRRRRRD
ncbi:MAG: PEP-CTERM sorting domain-containing protein [Akkermansiaceae bacterium]|nr:PEP-CTERM sorting domain-containing protein [Akkermansiaceae bacterium]